MKAWRIGAAVAIVALAAGLAAGSGGASGSKGPLVVLVTDVNQLNDHGFNQLAYAGLLHAQRSLGVDAHVYQATSSQSYIPNLARAAQNGATLVISVGFDQATAVAKVAKQFPKTHFAIIDVDQTTLAGKPKNVEGLIFREQEVGYLAGYLAGLLGALARHTRCDRVESAARSSRRSTATSRATRRARARPIRP